MRTLTGSGPARWLVAAGILLLVTVLAFPGLGEQVRRLRHAELRDAVVSVATRADHGMAQHRSYPATIAGPVLSDVTFSYTTDTARQDYSVNAYNTKWQVWAGANGRKLRCTCRDCPVSSLDGAATSCPAGTQPF
ncbi:hypothetical protein [Uliginosibacterium sp. H1]|uniref:hypothetical protein n=1 Tax=Uliginosibacterium sp. H1 TaxID=3114757 RepID=UPI002E195A2A|nr:hypothetical protein [Uliginosibacterium sp. H1]